MKYKLYPLILCLVWAFPSLAQNSAPLKFSFNLDEAIEYAQNHQVAVLNAQLDQKIASNTVKQTIGIGLPQINGSANFQDYLKVPTSLLPGEFFGQQGTLVPVKFGVTYQSSIGADLSQLLFDGTYLVGLKASKTYKELSTRNLQRSRIETAVAVTKAYYSVLVNNEQLSLLDANLLRLKKSLNDTEALFKNGFVEKIDVDRLSVLKNNLETERQNVTRLLALNVNLLKFQMGMPVEAELSLKDSINNLNIEKNTVTADTTAYQSRIEFALMQTQKKLNELDLKRYKSLFLPSLSAFGNTGKSWQSNNFSTMFDMGFPSTVVGLRLMVPIMSGGQKLYRVRNAKLEVEKTQNNLENLKNGINLEIAQAQTIYVNGLESLDNQKRNMELATEVLRVSKIKYDQGVGSSLEVTTAETSLKESQNNYINALYDMLINKVNLDRALGKINY
ncbi:MAG TPA: TolC family protein [Daejeonella sp.]|nr:TolC family protein [Daejeonella sp.]